MGHHTILRPDIAADLDKTVDDTLIEIKTIAHGVSTYTAVRDRGVDARATKIPAEYGRHAKNNDRACHGIGDGSGPFSRKLQQHPPVVPVVFGAFGEASRQTSSLFSSVATAFAKKCWREMGARSMPEALGLTTQRIRRQWGIAAVRAHALALRRAVSAARGRSVNMATEQSARRRHHRHEQAAYAVHTSGFARAFDNH